MFGGGGANENMAIPAFLGENGLPFDNNALPQLQLFGHAPSVQEHVSFHNGAIKRVREEDLTCTRQKRPISLNKNYSPEKVANIDIPPNPNLVFTGLRLSCEKEQNSSVSSGILSVGNNLKMEMDRQTEEFGRYIKLQDFLCSQPLKVSLCIGREYSEGCKRVESSAHGFFVEHTRKRSQQKTTREGA